MEVTMPSEQDKTIDGLKYAIQMEIDGKVLYLKSSQESGNELGRKLLESLAQAEDYHRITFEKIFDTFSKKQGWPVVDFKVDGGRTQRTVFAKELTKKPPQIKPMKSEFDAVQRGQELEAKSYDFYHMRSEQAESEAEREFYGLIAAEEREHQLVLNDYAEFLKNPAGWFVKTEKPSLDGST
jgi:rubrerythrin